MKKIVLATTNKEVSPREIAHGKLSRQLAQEGMVLLKNDGMIPLVNKRIALYGSGARRTIAGGTGSGATHARHYVSIEEGLLNAGYQITTTSWLNKYDHYYDTTYANWKKGIEEKIVGVYDLFKILGVVSQNKFVYPTGIAIEDCDIDDNVDDAIYVIARQAGEGVDRYDRPADYQLDDLEKANLAKICKHHKNVLVVVNVGGFIDLSYVEGLNVSAILYYCQAGMNGGDAFADVVSGKVSPSGKLTATWAKNLADFPSTEKFSHNGDTLQQDYNEGIYVGYRYFDSFNVQPLYCFGHGLSYTQFSISAAVDVNGEQVTATAKVANMGGYDGKEVVQVYVSVPQTESGAEYQRLVAFAKTKTLKTNETERVAMTFGLRDLAIYDEARASWILPQGDYVIRVGNSSRNTKVAAVLDVQQEIICETCTNVCKQPKPIAEIVAPKRAHEDLTDIPRIPVFSSAVKTVVNSYTEVPVSTSKRISNYLSKLSNRDIATLLMGGDTSGERLVNVMGASGSTTMALCEKYGIPNIILSDGPAGLNVTPQVVDVDGELKPTEPYPQYDYGFFGQMMRKRLAQESDGVCHYQYATAFPASVVRAQTWNISLMEQLGDALGTEMEEFGVTVWLAPGLNIMRNTLCGRTFEYCSEDPVLSGEIAAAVALGVQKHVGKGVSLKHFACNNSEDMRDQSSSNLSERALREIYLKGFERAVKKANPATVMASYNKINGVYSTNNYDVLVKVLRNEWGFANAVISDWDSVLNGKALVAEAVKAQCDLVMPGHANQIDELAKFLDDGTVSRLDAERCAERIIKLIETNTVVPFKAE